MKLSEYLELPEQSQKRLAEKLGVTQGAVSQWVKDGVRAERVKEIVVATNGVVTAHELRPDLYPPDFEFPPDMLGETREAAA